MFGRVHVRINPDSWGLQVSHVHCGLAELAAIGRIHLEFDARIPIGPRATMWASIDGAPCFFDMQDGPSLVLKEPEKATWYFKRTYRRCLATQNVAPYGLIYSCRPGVRTDKTLWRHPSRVLQYRSRQTFEIDPLVPAEPRVFFLTRLWNTTMAHGRDEARMDKLNGMRAETVRALKREFGKRFTGGLADNELARSRYPELIADGTSKRVYLQSLRRCAVGVTTIGLHESTGHKLAEYLAASRCIVTESLAHDLPEPLRERQNIISFDTPDKCVEACGALIEDHAVRDDMREANHDYYFRNVRPAAAISRCLRVMLQQRDRPRWADLTAEAPSHVTAIT